jgi:flagella basal body P-ring formation protein FlgA
MRGVLAMVLAITPAAWADTITLRDDVYVRGPQVKLAEVADIDGEHAGVLGDLEVASAAAPGLAKRISAALVEARVRGAGFGADQVTMKGAPAVSATTLHLEITPGMLVEDLRAYVRREMPWDPSAALVDITAPQTEYQVPDGKVSVTWRPDPQYEYLGQGNFRGEISVDGQVQRTVFARATVAAYEFVVVATQPIARGDVISATNARLDKRELSALDPGAFFSMQDATGRIAKTTIHQGQALTARRLELATLVERNQLVPVETHVGQLIIRGQAKALADVAAGEVILLLNVASNQKLSGVVRPDGVVEVQ